jgi:hypothetical protein
LPRLLLTLLCGFQRLKSALWFAVGKIVDEASLERNLNASPQFIGALAEMVWMQIESVATDVESFAHVSLHALARVNSDSAHHPADRDGVKQSKHAGRSTIKTDDVLLLSRNNHDLHALLKDHIDKLETEKIEKQAKKR